MLGIKSRNFANIIIILLNIAGGRGNYLLFGLLNIPSSLTVVGIVIFIDILYIFLRYRGNFILRLGQFSKPIRYILLLLAYNSLNIWLSGDQSPTLCFGFLILSYLFAVILMNITIESQQNNKTLYNNALNLSLGYIILSLISIIGVVVSFTLVSMGLKHDVYATADFLYANERPYDYYLSFFSLCFNPLSIRVPFFQEYGIFTGLFHEPHIFAHNVFPCLLLLFGFIQKNVFKTLVFFALVLVVLFSGSTTNIIVAFICLLVYYLSHDKINNIASIFVAIVVGVLLYYYTIVDDTFYSVIMGRMAEDNQSNEVSRNLLSYAFTPKSLFGTNFLSTSFVFSTNHSQDIGFIAFTLNILFLLSYAKNTMILIQKKDNLCFFTGLASLYYILHAAKIGMPMYIQTVPIILVFIQSILLSVYGRVKTNREII